jgi:PAS domain S-box-containing protein
MEQWGAITNQVLSTRMLGSRTFGARTLASPLRWALWQLQPTVAIIQFCALALLSILAIPLCALSSAPAEGQPRGKNVLVIFSAVQYSQSTLELIEPAMRARVPGPITFYDAYLEDPQVEEKSYRESVSETLRRRYAKVKLDVVIVCNPAALHFAVEYRDKIFPGVPIVFVGVGAGDLKNQKIWPGVTGVANPWGFRETIDLMLRLQPDTSTVAVVAGDTLWDKQFVAVAHEELLRHQDKVREIDLVGPPNRQLYERVAALPPHTVVLFQAYPQFANQPEFGTWDLVAAVSQRLPTYSVFPRLCVDGCIGGAYDDYTKEDLWTAEIAARVLSGERPDNIPVAYATDLQVQVDWRALRRWQIPESALPLGSLVLNREPTLWERYRKYIFVAMAVIAIQLLLIFGLLWQRVRKQKLLSVLRESEKRFRVMANTTPSLIWMCDQEGKIIYLNERLLAFTGTDPKAGYGELWSTSVHPDDLKIVSDGRTRALKSHESFADEYRLRRDDGVYRWIFDVASPRLNGDGSFAGFIGSAVDITDQKMAREALEKVSGQLIAAQEKERSHLARELHDDICQRLALLSIRIEKVTQDSASGQTPVGDQLKQIWQQCSTLTADVQSLSHELHPSILDNLGLVTAAKSFCREISEHSGAVVEFTSTNMPPSLPREVSLSLFRVIQEALHNSVKYSRAKRFEVHLQGRSSEVELEVSDAGVGFDAVNLKAKGLGMVSMQERINFLRGRFSVQSRVGEGTKIIVSVPLIESQERLKINE